jgi:hypothetical protein
MMGAGAIDCSAFFAGLTGGGGTGIGERGSSRFTSTSGASTTASNWRGRWSRRDACFASGSQTKSAAKVCRITEVDSASQPGFGLGKAFRPQVDVPGASISLLYKGVADP